MICKISVKLPVFVCSCAVFQWRTAAHPHQLSLLVNTCQGDCSTRNKKQSLDMSRHIRQIHRIRGFAMVSHKHSRPCIPLLCAVRPHHHSAPAGTIHGWVWLNHLRCGNHCVWIFSSSTYAEPHVLHVVLSSSAASYRSYSMSWAWHRAQMSLSVQRLHFPAAWVNFRAILQDFHFAPPNRWFPWEGPVGQVKTVVPSSLVCTRSSPLLCVFRTKAMQKLCCWCKCATAATFWNSFCALLSASPHWAAAQWRPTRVDTVCSNTMPLRHAPRCPDHHDTREAANKKGIPPTSVDLMRAYSCSGMVGFDEHSCQWQWLSPKLSRVFQVIGPKSSWLGSPDVRPTLTQCLKGTRLFGQAQLAWLWWIYLHQRLQRSVVKIRERHFKMHLKSAHPGTTIQRKPDWSVRADNGGSADVILPSQFDTKTNCCSHWSASAGPSSGPKMGQRNSKNYVANPTVSKIISFLPGGSLHISQDFTMCYSIISI